MGNLSAKSILAVFAIASLLSACTKKDPTQFQDTSGIKFQYVKPTSPEVIAAYKDFQIQLSMVLSQSPPLRELFQIENDFLFVKAYEQAAEEAKNATQKVTLKFYLPLSDKFEVVLQKNQIPQEKNLTLVLEKAVNDEDLAASIDTRTLSRHDLSSLSVQYASLKRRQVEEIVARIKGIVIRSEYAKLAETAKLPLEEYLKKNVYPGDLTPSNSEIEAFIKETGLTEPDLTDDVKKKLVLIVEERKRNALLNDHFVKQVQTEPIQIHSAPARVLMSNSQTIDTVWGFADAPVHIQLFSDLNCQPCLEQIKNVVEFEKQLRGQLKISINSFFSEQNQNSRLLAEASMCANAQSKKKLRSFIEKFSQGGVLPEEESLYGLAKDIGANTEDFKKCVVARDQSNLVNDHLRFSKGAGVRAQPTIVIGGQVIEGPLSKDVLRRLVSDEVNAYGDSWLKVTWRKVKGFFGE